MRSAYPALVTEIENAAITAERNRIQAIENMALPGFETIVADAKFKNPITAEALAVSLIAAQKKAGDNYLAGRAEDCGKSGVGAVKNMTPDDGGKNEKAEQDKHDDAILDRIFGSKA